MALGKTILKRAEKALKSGIINKREFNNLIKATSGRISNSNTISQNITLGKVNTFIKESGNKTTLTIEIEVKRNEQTPKQSIKDTSTFGGYVGERQQVARQREQGKEETEIRRALLKDIQPVFDAANKRLKRLNDFEVNNIALPALRALRSEKPTGNFSSAGKTVDELIKEYRLAVQFMSHETSTLKGASKHINQSMKTFGGSAKQASQRRMLLDDMLNDKSDMSSSNYADFTTWISTHISTIDSYDESEVRKKVDEIEEKRRRMREDAIEKAKKSIGKPKVSSSLLRDLLS